MGQYKYSIYWSGQIGFLILMNDFEFCFYFPFFTFVIGRTQHAKGRNFLNKK